MDKAKVLAGRKAVETYRLAHSTLHLEPQHKNIPEDHTPLLDAMLVELKKRDFATLQEFFDASDLLNIQELGFDSKEEFEAVVNRNAKEKEVVDDIGSRQIEKTYTKEAVTLLIALGEKWK